MCSDPTSQSPFPQSLSALRLRILLANRIDLEKVSIVARREPPAHPRDFALKLLDTDATLEGNLRVVGLAFFGGLNFFTADKLIRRLGHLKRECRQCLLNLGSQLRQESLRLIQETSPCADCATTSARSEASVDLTDAKLDARSGRRFPRAASTALVMRYRT